MKRLMDRIGETVKGRIAEAELSPSEDEIRKYILREFARNGRPPSPKEIMNELELSSVDLLHQTIEKLQKFDIITKKKDKIISAYPFSAAKTRHRVILKMDMKFMLSVQQMPWASILCWIGIQPYCPHALNAEKK